MVLECQPVIVQAFGDGEWALLVGYQRIHSGMEREILDRLVSRTVRIPKNMSMFSAVTRKSRPLLTNLTIA
ncbi:hypothetical protein A6U88_32085 [Agrobacterium sp. B131/95]|nr:hypothetical protein A6U88_32085 [Agrobacterium sp. B131/95]